MNFGTEWNILYRQSVSRQNVGILAADDHRSNLYPERSNNVSLFAVQIKDQSDMSGTIRIVLDLRNTSRNSRFIPLEIDDPILTLVASATAANGDPSVAVASRNSLF